MITTKRTEIYKVRPIRGRRGQTNISNLRNKKGVYRIYEDNKLVYIGSSLSDLYKTILRHFQEWNDSAQPNRINYKKRLNKHRYTVEATLMQNDQQIWLIEAQEIKKSNPRDNKDTNYTIYNHKFKGNDKQKKDCCDAYKESRKAENKIEVSDFQFNDKGELLDENGNVLF